MAKSLLDKIGQEQASKLMSDATHKAIAEAHAHGLPVTVDVKGVTSLVHPNGDVEPVEPAQELAKD